MGDYTKGVYADGSIQKVMIHTMVGGLLAEASGGDFKTGALAAGANEALVDQLDTWVGGDKFLLDMTSQLVGLLAASTLDGADAESLQTGAWVARNATQYNRQLHESEKSLAKVLAENSNGKFTEEQIQDALRVSIREEEGIFPNTDMIASERNIYDTGGRWVRAGDGEIYIQLLPVDVDPDVVRYILDNSNGYSFDDSTLGIFREQENNGKSVHSRDRLTGYALDNEGGYRMPIVIEGVAYSPRFWPCSSTECLATGANIDFGNADTLRWIKAADAKSISDLGQILAAGAFVTTGGTANALGYASTSAGLLSGYLKDSTGSAISESVLGVGFQKYAMSRGVPEEVAKKMTNALSVSGAWNVIVKNGKDFLDE